VIFGYSHLSPPPCEHLGDPLARAAGQTEQADQWCIQALAMRNAAALPRSPFGAFDGSGAGRREDWLPRGMPGGVLMGWHSWWLRIRLLFIDTRNRRRPLVPSLLRSGALRMVS
jgi:hypothetical protein